ncbi:hypothetical protein EJ02DRAFT_458756 [Clathrospora elynae]|uniref:Uncharacterized protein n=1 Tax=Clathrospora elynae TaxID=706981 RepID=A0A6A5SA15_9PLEO|nr:hypothetical protein EJ02DRAFT_458756 [Clathrospora elynae]
MCKILANLVLQSLVMLMATIVMLAWATKRRWAHARHKQERTLLDDEAIAGAYKDKVEIEN